MQSHIANRSGVAASAIVAILLASVGAVLPQTVGPANIQWQKIYGGDRSDRQACLARTSDGGFILGGHTYSGISGNKETPGFGEWDYWVLRLDHNGNKLWEGTFGGDYSDLLWDVQETLDGGVILAGESESLEWGNKTAPGLGYSDFWLVRLDSAGNKLWDKSFGGRDPDRAHKVLQTPDGGFLVGGSSYSDISGNKTNVNIGFQDFWIVRLDAQGEKLWERVYGGLGEDLLTDARQTTDGGFILAGRSSSGNDGTKTSTNYGGYDLWLVRMDAAGNQLWDRSFGGAADDGGKAIGEGVRVIQTSDGGFFVGCSTTSGISGNKTTPFYGGFVGDYWVLRLDADGNKLWEQDFGGSQWDTLTDVRQSLDGGFIVAGFSNSGADGNKTAPLLNWFDLWVVRLDPSGTKIWDQTYTGLTNFAWPRLQATPDGGMMTAAQQGHPAELQTMDLTLLKLSADALTAPQLRALGRSANECRFQLSGISNRTYVTEFSSDLQNWSPLTTNQLASGSVEVLDPGASGAKRFYRARMVE